MLPRALALAALMVPAVACSSFSDASGKSDTYPAFGPDVGRLTENDGVLIATPKIVTITWSGDPHADDLETFGDKLGASSYWKATAGEYGVSAAVSGSGRHVRLTEAAPATIDPDTIEQLIADHVASAPSNGWPAHDDSTIYVVYTPETTTLTPADPYHAETSVGDHAHVAFVVVGEASHGSKSVLDAVTAAASHEIVETATNPHVLSDPPAVGVVGFDSKHLAWQLTTGDAELGDVCEKNEDAVFQGPDDLPYTLQRLWSNKAAFAGHNPCVPAPSEPYYNVAPIGLETVSVFVDSATKPTSGLGYRVPIGHQKTIHLGFYSDSPMCDWKITAVEGNYLSPPSNHRLTIAVTQASGNNGTTGSITVTANAESTGAGNAVLLTVISEAPGLAKHATPIVIGTY